MHQATVDALALSMAADSASTQTIRQYAARVKAWLESGLTPADFIRAAGPSAEGKLRRQALLTLKARGLWPAYKQVPDTFPAVKVAPGEPVPYISPETARIFFEETAERLTKSIRDLTAVKMFYATGCRQQELVQAKRTDLYRDAGDTLLRVKGKGRRPREIPLPHYATRILARYDRWERPASEEKANRHFELTGERRADFILLSAEGSCIDVRPAQSLIRVCCSAMDIPQPQHPLHMLRSWYATHLSEQGVDVVDISLLMGHASIKETMPYLLRNPAKARRAVKRHAMNEWGAYKEQADTLGETG